MLPCHTISLSILRAICSVDCVYRAGACSVTVVILLVTTEKARSISGLSAAQLTLLANQQAKHHLTTALQNRVPVEATMKVD